MGTSTIVLYTVYFNQSYRIIMEATTGQYVSFDAVVSSNDTHKLSYQTPDRGDSSVYDVTSYLVDSNLNQTSTYDLPQASANTLSYPTPSQDAKPTLHIYTDYSNNSHMLTGEAIKDVYADFRKGVLNEKDWAAWHPYLTKDPRFTKGWTIRKAHLDELKTILDKWNIPYQISPTQLKAVPKATKASTRGRKAKGKAKSVPSPNISPQVVTPSSTLSGNTTSHVNENIVNSAYVRGDVKEWLAKAGRNYPDPPTRMTTGQLDTITSNWRTPGGENATSNSVRASSPEVWRRPGDWATTTDTVPTLDTSDYESEDSTD